MRNDQIFTPDVIVTRMLDKLGYSGEAIKSKTILEPSFGGGAFLIQIANRIFDYASEHKLSAQETIAILNNVHGVEIDKKWYDHTKTLLIELAKSHNVDYDWPNLINGDATKMKYIKQFDLLVGNPPFCRCHDLSLDERTYIEENYSFGSGNTDLYVIFFELSINALKSDGKMCFITPNSFLKNSSQKQFRDYLSKKSIIKAIDDYATVKVFGKIATYTAITLIDMKGCTKTNYSMMEDIKSVNWSNSVSLSSMGSKPWSFVCKSDEKFLKGILSKKTKIGDLCTIQYGLATNADSVYLVEPNTKIEPNILRPVAKGSTLALDKRIIFPYTFNETSQKYDLIDETTLREHYPKAYNHLFANKEKLEARDMEKGSAWYQYGRSQGIQNSNNAKLVLKHIVSEFDTTCAIRLLDPETLVYSGMFIVVKNEDNYLRVMRALTSIDFCRYVKLVGKDMAGGYKSFNTAIVKNFGIDEE